MAAIDLMRAELARSDREAPQILRQKPCVVSAETARDIIRHYDTLMRIVKALRDDEPYNDDWIGK